MAATDDWSIEDGQLLEFIQNNHRELKDLTAAAVLESVKPFNLETGRWTVIFKGRSSDWPPPSRNKSDVRSQWTAMEIFCGAVQSITFFPKLRCEKPMYLCFVDNLEYFQCVFPPNYGTHPANYTISSTQVASLLKHNFDHDGNENLTKLRLRDWNTLLDGSKFSMTSAPHHSGDRYHITIAVFDRELLKKVNGQVHLDVFSCSGSCSGRKCYKWKNNNSHLHVWQISIK